MKVLVENEKILRLSGLFPSDQSTMIVKIRQLATNFLVSTCLSAYVLGSAFHVYLHHDDIPGMITCLLQFSGSLSALVAYLENLFNPKVVKRIYSELQRIVNDG